MPQSDFIVNDSPSGRVYVNPAHADAVEGLGLGKYADAMRFVGGETVDRNRKRSVVKVVWSGRAFFLKRFTDPPLKDALGRLALLRRPRTHAGCEWDMAEALGDAGIGAPEIAAVGEETGALLRKRSFLLTPELEGFVPLSDHLKGFDPPSAPREERILLILELAALARRMHDAGITHPDLYSYHVFVKTGEGGRSFALIDLHRASKKSRVSLYDAVRDLTGLHLTIPATHASRADRFRFLRAYFGDRRLGGPGRRMARKVEARAKRIGSRKRFAEYR